jgi:hypothetical protein
VKLAVTIEPAADALPDVDYRWDVDTDILTARLCADGGVDGGSGSLEIVGSDGSWLVFDVRAGRIGGVEVAVWPTVRSLAALAPPAAVQDARALVPRRGSGIAAVEVSTVLAAESDRAERTIHFRVGPRRPARAVRIARDVLLDVDARERIAGVWLLNVPPFPGEPADPLLGVPAGDRAAAAPSLPLPHPPHPEHLAP